MKAGFHVIDIEKEENGILSVYLVLPVIGIDDHKLEI